MKEAIISQRVSDYLRAVRAASEMPIRTEEDRDAWRDYIEHICMMYGRDTFRELTELIACCYPFKV